EPDDAEVWRQRRKRIIGDLRLGGGDARDERRFPCVRESDESDVGEKLQLEPQILFFAGLAWLHFARGAIGRRCKVRVAEAAASAVRHEYALPRFGEIREQTQRLARIASLFVHECADRDGELQICAGMARAVRALTVLAALGAELRMEAIVDESVRVRTCDD